MSFFTFSLIYLCKLESQKVFVHFTDAPINPSLLLAGPVDVRRLPPIEPSLLLAELVSRTLVGQHRNKE
jgi:hypothetical protein